MLYEVILAQVDVESSNDSALFPKKVIEEYLGSDRCKTKLSDRTMLGSLTHKHRYGAEETEGFGYDDKLLEEAVILFCIPELWLDGNNLMATLDVFDNYEDYSQDQVGKIKQLMRLLKNKVNVPISIVTDADWTKDNRTMTYLYDILGADVTLNPAFAGAKIMANGK